MIRGRISRRLGGQLASGALALVIGIGFAGGTLADNKVTTTVLGGTRTASVKDLDLGTVTYSHSDVTKTGTMALTADDSSGTNAGWNVQVVASDFVYGGSYSGDDITADNFALTSAADPVRVAGQGVSPAQGPKVPATSPVGTLDTARKVVQANAKFGKGTYSQDLGVSLNVPADSVVGTYTSTLTVTIVAGP